MLCHYKQEQKISPSVGHPIANIAFAIMMSCPCPEAMCPCMKSPPAFQKQTIMITAQVFITLPRSCETNTRYGRNVVH